MPVANPYYFKHLFHHATNTDIRRMKLEALRHASEVSVKELSNLSFCMYAALFVGLLLS